MKESKVFGDLKKRRKGKYTSKDCFFFFSFLTWLIKKMSYLDKNKGNVNEGNCNQGKMRSTLDISRI